MNARIVLVAWLAAALSSPAAASSLSFIAREGTLYAGDQLVSDSGGPAAEGIEGDVYQQFLGYAAILQSFAEEQTVWWDDNTEQFVGFVENATNQPFTAKSSETVDWQYSAGSWGVVATSAAYTDGSTSLVERSPIVAPLIPPSGGGDTYLTPEQILELEYAGVDAALRANLDPNYDLSSVTRDQLLADLRRLEAILAGGSNPPVPLPAPLGLFAAGALVMLRQARRGRQP